MSPYHVPRQTVRVTYRVSNSRFIGTIGRAQSVPAAKAFIQAVRDEMPDASHHVYAYIVGHGATVTEGMSDDGEPSGTAGPPTLAVLRGSDIGDVVLVTTRYFGGTKLGTGGLVQAYGQTAKDAVAALPTVLKVERVRLAVDVPYPLYEPVTRLLDEYGILRETEDFGAAVSLVLAVPRQQEEPFRAALQELSAGQVNPVNVDEEDTSPDA